MRRWPEARKSLNEALRDIQDRCNGSSADKCNTWRPVAPIGPRGSEDDRVRSRRGVKKHLRDPPLHSQTELMPRFNAIRRGLSRHPLITISKRFFKSPA